MPTSWPSRPHSLSPAPLRSLALGLLARERGRIGEARTYLQEALSGRRLRPTPMSISVPPWRSRVLHVRLDEGALAIAALDSVDHIDDPELAGDTRTTEGHRAVAERRG